MRATKAMIEAACDSYFVGDLDPEDTVGRADMEHAINNALALLPDPAPDTAIREAVGFVTPESEKLRNAVGHYLLGGERDSLIRALAAYDQETQDYPTYDGAALEGQR